MAHIESLLELQTLDLQIDKTHKRLTQIKATLAGSDDLNKAIHFVKTIQMELERLNKSRRGFETEIHKLDQRVDDALSVDKHPDLIHGKAKQPAGFDNLQPLVH